MEFRFFLRIIIFISIALWCAGFSINSITADSGFTSASTPILNLFYDNVCHQDKDKLISTGSFSFLVCARCSGIYFGALIASALLVFPLKEIKISLQLFKLSSVILFIDVVLNNFVLPNYNKISAFSTGLFFGFICLIILLNMLKEYSPSRAEI